MPVRPLFDLREDVVPVERGRSLSCVSCGLYKNASSPRMRPHGDGERRIMVIGEAPGDADDKRGTPWRGSRGSMLRDVLYDLGYDLDRDCVSLNSVNCRLDRPPTAYEVACCRFVKVDPAIVKYFPRVILLMGGSAVSSVLGPLCPEAVGGSVGKWRGFTVPIPEWGAWVCPTFDVDYVKKHDDRPEIETLWRSDVARALRLLDATVPTPDDLGERVELLHREVDVLRAIYEAHSAPLLSYDYETTGLMPSIHDVVCASFAYSPDRAYAFMMPESGPIPGAWAKLMSDPNVGKISHNFKFENEWTLEHFEVDDINWAWDSMLAAHVVDNRVGICGLKLQCFINFGIRSWDYRIEPYLEGIDKRDLTSPNRIREFIDVHGDDECMIYCGIDSILCFRLATKQMEQIK